MQEEIYPSGVLLIRWINDDFDLRSSILLWSIFLPVTKWEYPEKPHDTVSHVVWVAVVCTVHLVVTFGLFGILYQYSFSSLTPYADALGIISAIVAAIQYAPQVWTTWRLRHIGSISIPWLIVQTPGGLVAMSALVGRPGTNWTTWLASIGTFLGQVVLLIVCCCFAWRDWRAKRRDERYRGVIRDKWTWKSWPRKVWRWIFY